MAFEFDPDEMFRHCALYLQKGLKIVRVEGIWPSGYCTCGNKSHHVNPETFEKTTGARKCGKHPVGDEWAHKYARSEDDIEQWLSDGKPFNVGVILGPDGGIIDNEDDDPAGAAYRELLGISNLETPTWTSGKSTHQASTWHPSLLAVKKQKVVISGLEIRIGCGKMTQSVLPPSWHWSGVQYKWKPGFTLDDIPIAETPKSLLLALVNEHDGKPTYVAAEEPARNLLFGTVKDGEGRHFKMLRWMWLKFMKTDNPLESRTSEEMLQELQDTNKCRLVPPKDEDEIVEMFNTTKESFRRRLETGWRPRPEDRTDDAIDRVVRQIMSGKEDGPPPVCGLAQFGLEPYAVGKMTAYRPVSWRIEMVKSDPPEIVLCVPAWENTPCRGRVSLTMDDYRSAQKVASAVFTATQRVMLDANPSMWRRVWHGSEPSKKTEGAEVAGLAQLLMEKKMAADDLPAGVSSLRYAVVSGWLLEAFRKATSPKDEEKPEPNESGRPCRMGDGSLWFKWAKTWEDIGRMHDVQMGDRLKLKRMLCDEVGVSDFQEERHSFGGVRHSYVVFNKAFQAALERLAAGKASEANDALIGGKSGDVNDVAPEKNSAMASI